MARQRTAHLGVLNMALLNHSHDNYIKLFNKYFKDTKKEIILGARCAISNSVEYFKDKDVLLVTFYTYTKIDPTKPWYDSSKNDVIVDDNGKPINQIEKNIHPNSKVVFCVFDLSHHRLVFNQRDISYGSIQKFFEILYKSEPLNITMEQSTETMSRILNMYHISSLEILIRRPNPDDISSFEAKFKERLESQNADMFKEEFKTKQLDGIKPDEDTKSLIKIANSNGYTIASGKNELGESVRLSTEDTPLTLKHKYSSKESFVDFLIDIAPVIAKDIIKKMKK